MIYREARKLHNLIFFYFRLSVVRCFVSWETRLLNFFPRKIEVQDDYLFRAIQKLGDRTHSLGTVKVSTSTAPKIITIPCKPSDLKAEVYSVPQLAHSQLTCAIQNSCLILFQCYIASCFLCSLDKTYFLITRVSDYNVCESRDPSRQLLKCHAATTLPFNSLAAAATKKQDGNNVIPIISAELEEVKKERKNFHSFICHTTVHQHMKTAGVFIMPKIPEILVEVK